jgi:hypothetical protein
MLPTPAAERIRSPEVRESILDSKASIGSIAIAPFRNRPRRAALFGGVPERDLFSSLSVQQSGFGETVGKPLGILFPLEGQPAQMFAEQVFRIDLHELAPNATGLVHLAEMTESGHERGP